MASAAAKILVIRGGAIGDFILTLPVLAAIRERFPEARLEVLGYPHIAQLALTGRLVDEVRSIDAAPLAGFFARNGKLDTTLQDYFASFAIIISYLYDPDQIFQANVARSSKAQFIAGQHRPDENAGLHATQVFLRPLERLAIFDADPVPRLNLLRKPQDTSQDGRRLSLSHPMGEGRGEGSSEVGVAHPEAASTTKRPILPETLALHPGSGSEQKNWPEKKWAELLHTLVETTRLQLLIVSGEAEEERLPRLMDSLPRSRIVAARNLPLPELAARLAGCAGFMGHDSGITHLAAAVGLPLLVLWGNSSEQIWKPQSRKLTVLKDPRGLKEISVEQVLAAVAAMLGSQT